ncbi:MULTISPECIES: hypothetical protein [Actinomadura]|uniref:hypothetical protein n=1 Tax=unclassified Actinomadura TaxID=2626254 RepID=UPI003399371E
MRKTACLVMAVVASGVLTAAPSAEAARRENVTKTFDVTFAKQWDSKRFSQNAGTDTFKWQCLGVPGEPYYFEIYKYDTIVSPPRRVLDKDYKCKIKDDEGKPLIITESVQLEYGVYTLRFSKPPGPDGIHVKGTGTYPKQTD